MTGGPLDSRPLDEATWWERHDRMVGVMPEPEGCGDCGDLSHRTGVRACPNRVDPAARRRHP